MAALRGLARAAKRRGGSGSGDSGRTTTAAIEDGSADRTETEPDPPPAVAGLLRMYVSDKTPKTVSPHLESMRYIRYLTRHEQTDKDYCW